MLVLICATNLNLYCASKKGMLLATCKEMENQTNDFHYSIQLGTQKIHPPWHKSLKWHWKHIFSRMLFHSLISSKILGLSGEKKSIKNSEEALFLPKYSIFDIKKTGRRLLPCKQAHNSRNIISISFSCREKIFFQVIDSKPKPRFKIKCKYSQVATFRSI